LKEAVFVIRIASVGHRTFGDQIEETWKKNAATI
jgi:hypothetical protein